MHCCNNLGLISSAYPLRHKPILRAPSERCNFTCRLEKRDFHTTETPYPPQKIEKELVMATSLFPSDRKTEQISAEQELSLIEQAQRRYKLLLTAQPLSLG